MKAATNIQEELNQLRESGFLKGEFTGFTGLYDIFSLKKGYPIYVAGAPHAGKTEFVLELLVITSELYGWKHAIYLGETGTPAEITAELCYKFVKKPFLTKKSKGEVNEYAMTESERYSAEEWVKEHFVIFEEDNNEDFTIWNFYKSVDNYQKINNIKFDTTVIDPVMHLEIPASYMGEHNYLKDALKFCNNNSKEQNRINFLINHIADLPALIDKETGNRYYPRAMPNEWAGGRMWHRFAFTMLLVYRPPSWMKDENGLNLYYENQTIIENQKAKPKGSGKIGECSLFWDWQKNRYYELVNEQKQYAHGEKPL